MIKVRPTLEGNGSGWRVWIDDVPCGYYERAHQERGFRWYADNGGCGGARLARDAQAALIELATRGS